MGLPFIKRIEITGYKSIATCDVRLERLTLLVGRNAAGKSNFLDALAFVWDSLDSNLDQALRKRGGIEGIQHLKRATGGRRSDIRIALTIDLPDAGEAVYSATVGARGQQGVVAPRHVVKEERLEVRDTHGRRESHYVVSHGTLKESSVADLAGPLDDRLFLPRASDHVQFRAVYAALRAMGFYNLNPASMRELQTPDGGAILRSNGENVASVIARITATEPKVMGRINDYLSAVVPGLAQVARREFDRYETVEFEQSVAEQDQTLKFSADSMSDGTLRVLGLLVAVMQGASPGAPLLMVGIEEPEAALHPAAAAAVMDVLREATRHVQVLITTHSPDLLELFDPRTESLLVVESQDGKSRVGPPDAASIESIRDHLYTAGELLRRDQLSVETDEPSGLLFDKTIDPPGTDTTDAPA